MSNRDGFTVIELTLFLTISGLLLIMAFVGAGNMARYARFSDTVNSFQSLVLRQYDSVLNGVNARAASDPCSSGSPTAGSDDSCVLLGRIMSWQIGAGTPMIKVWPVISTNTTVPDTGDIYSQIGVAGPSLTVKSTTTEAYDLSWGATFQESSRSSNKTSAPDPLKTGSVPSRALINAVAFLRGPNEARVVRYYFYSSNYNNAATLTSSLRSAVADPTKTTGAVTASLCINNTQDWAGATSPVAALVFDSGSGSSAIQTNFDPLRTGITAICA